MEFRRVLFRSTPVNESGIVLRGVKIRSPVCGHNRIHGSHSVLELLRKEESQRRTSSLRHNTAKIKYALCDIGGPVVPTVVIGFTIKKVSVKPRYIDPGGVDLVSRQRNSWTLLPWVILNLPLHTDHRRCCLPSLRTGDNE